MSVKPLKLLWECGYCGTQNESEFQSAELLCAACGSDELSEGGANFYAKLLELNKKRIPSELLEKPLREKAQTKVVESLNATFPQFSGRRFWRDLTLFDLLWIIKINPEFAWDIPLQDLPVEAWNSIWGYCESPVFSVKRFVSTKSVWWLQNAAKEEKLSADILKRAVRLYASQPWFETNDSVLADFAEFIGKLATEKPLVIEVVSELPKRIQFEVWRRYPECPGLPENIFDDVAPDTAIHFLKDQDKAAKVLQLYPFNKFKPEHWRKAMRIVRDDPWGRFKDALWKAWESIDISKEALYKILESNPDICFLLPLDRFSPEQFLFLLPIVRVEGYDLAAYCPFDQFSIKQWVELLSNPRMPDSLHIEEAVQNGGIAQKLSRAEAMKVLDGNPAAIRFLDAFSLPVDKLVDVYLNHPDIVMPSVWMFTACDKATATKLLCNCGDRVPACADEMLATGSRQCFSSQDLEDLIRRNHSLAQHIPPERIKELSEATFFSYTVKFNGADFWVADYDLNRLDMDLLIRLVKLYPWLSSRIDLQTWSYDDLDELFALCPQLIRSYQHKCAYYIHKHKAAAYTVLVLCAIALLLGLTSLASLSVGYYLNARERARQSQTIANELALQNAKTTEAKALVQKEQLRKEHAAIEKAKLEETRRIEEAKSAKEGKAIELALQNAKMEEVKALVQKEQLSKEHAAIEKAKLEETRRIEEAKSAKERKAIAEANANKATEDRKRAEAEALTARSMEAKANAEAKQQEENRKKAELAAKRESDALAAKEVSAKAEQDKRLAVEAELKKAQVDKEKAELLASRAKADKTLAELSKESSELLDSFCTALRKDEDVGRAGELLDKLRNRDLGNLKDRLVKAEAFFDLMTKAKEGDAQSQVEVYKLYVTGAGFPAKDLNKARDWKKKIYDNKTACLMLASAYLKSNGLSKDVRAACDALDEVGNGYGPRLKFLIGYLYCEHATSVNDVSKGIKYLDDAADDDYLPANMYLANAYRRGIGTKLGMNYSKALKYYEAAAETNEGDAYYWLGVMHASWKYGDPDRMKALGYMKRAATLGTTYSRRNIGEWLELLSFYDKSIIKSKNKGWLDQARADLGELGLTLGD